MDKNYWIKFWKEYAADIKDKDSQEQVLRTFNKMPISKENWEYTLNDLDIKLDLKREQKILDLCSGNGLISNFLNDKGAVVTAVDVSKQLLGNINNPNIETIEADIRTLDFKDNSFDCVLIYAGLQYLDEKEAILLIQKIYKWLKPQGILYIGDIPDYDRIWNFFDTMERQKVYFNNVLDDKSIVGYWFTASWFNKIKDFIGFSEGHKYKQPPQLIYSHFRFDYKFVKK